jgi:hypothetical protein
LQKFVGAGAIAYDRINNWIPITVLGIMSGIQFGELTAHKLADKQLHIVIFV